MRASTIILLSGIAAAGGGGYYFYRRQINLLKESLTYKPIGFKVIELSISRIVISLKIRISSVSTLDADIQDVFVDLSLNDFYVGSVQNEGKIVIPAKGYSDINLIITTSPKSIVGDILKLLTSFLSSKDIVVKIKGFVRLKVLFFPVSTPFTYETALSEIMEPIN